LDEVDAPHPASPNPACVSTPALRGYHGGLTTTTTEGDEMYIGGGILTVILIVLLLIWLF
jgi:hypothetical protein